MSYAAKRKALFGDGDDSDSDGRDGSSQIVEQRLTRKRVLVAPLKSFVNGEGDEIAAVLDDVARDATPIPLKTPSTPPPPPPPNLAPADREAHARAVGLRTRLDNSNRGFQLFAKLAQRGASGNTALKNPAQQSTEPVSIEALLLRRGARAGLGANGSNTNTTAEGRADARAADRLDGAERQKKNEEALIARLGVEADGFRVRQQSRTSARVLQNDISRARAAIEQLDTAEVIWKSILVVIICI